MTQPVEANGGALAAVLRLDSFREYTISQSASGIATGLLQAVILAGSEPASLHPFHLTLEPQARHSDSHSGETRVQYDFGRCNTCSAR